MLTANCLKQILQDCSGLDPILDSIKGRKYDGMGMKRRRVAVNRRSDSEEEKKENTN